MAKGAVDLEKLAVLLQRRYNSLIEVDKLTDQLSESYDRDDTVSGDLVLSMRGDALRQCDGLWRDILDMQNAGPEAAGEIQRLVLTPPDQVSTSLDGALYDEDTQEMENRILDIRRKTLMLIGRIRRKDERVSLRLAEDKSYYREPAGES